MLFNYIIGSSLTSIRKTDFNPFAKKPPVKTGSTEDIVKLTSVGLDNSSKKTFSKKSLLTFGIVANLLLLGYFKYADFFISNINLASGSSFDLLHLALPLAISFFTFQQIAYLVDSYRGETKEYDFLNYALFVTFFPSTYSWSNSAS
jgi:D-alanyl-lipoteichoic acid acyltransferase DltB (MBOAT superfamily)